MTGNWEPMVWKTFEIAKCATKSESMRYPWQKAMVVVHRAGGELCCEEDPVLEKATILARYLSTEKASGGPRLNCSLVAF